MKLDPKAPLTPNLKAFLLECWTTATLEAAKREHGSCDVGAVAASMFNLKEHLQEARRMVEAAITAMESAPDLKKYCPTGTPEEIAGYLMQQIQACRASQKPVR